MITTSIVIGMEDNFPIILKSTGLAKDLDIAKWIFDHVGWNSGEYYPCLFYEIERTHWHESENSLSIDKSTLFILGHCLIMN